MFGLRGVDAPMRVLVTGGTGFIGRHVAAHLGARHHVSLFARSAGKDVLDPEALRADVARHDVLVHCAGLRRGNERELMTTHVLGTLYAAGACAAAHTPMVLASSGGVYQPVNPYAQSKALAEEVVRWHANHRALDAAVLRIFNVYGPGDRWGVVARFLEDDPIVIRGNKEAAFDFVHVTDVAAAIGHCLRPSGLFVSDVGTGVGTTIADLASLFGKRVVHDPGAADLGIEYSVARDVRIPGWTPRIRVQDGIQDLVRAGSAPSPPVPKPRP